MNPFTGWSWSFKFKNGKVICIKNAPIYKKPTYYLEEIPTYSLGEVLVKLIYVGLVGLF